MSEERDNDQGREEATRTLFDFDERTDAAQEQSAEDELGRVNYDEEVSLQNIFIEKSEDDVKSESREGAGSHEAAETVHSRDALASGGSSDSADGVSGVAAEESLGASGPLQGVSDSDSALDGEGERAHNLDISALGGEGATEGATEGSAKSGATATGAQAVGGTEAAVEIGTEAFAGAPSGTETNRAPIVEGEAATTVEEGAAKIGGRLIAVDPDQGDAALFSLGEGVSAPAGFELAPDGTYTFDPAVSAYDHLNVGDSVVLTVPVTVTDSQGAANTTSIVVTVTGTNDAPVAGADVASAVDEGGALLGGQLVSTDVDAGSSAIYAISDGVVAPDGFALSESGAYTFDPSLQAYDHLNVGDTVTLSIPVTVSDEHGATDSSLIQITVTGTNDAPVAGAVVASAEEGAAVISGVVTSTDLDDGATATYAVTEGAQWPEGFEFHSDGSYRFDPSDEAYESLHVGDSAVLTIPVTVTDEHGATDTTQIQITVTGTNDAPVAGAFVSATVNEGDSEIAGRLVAEDNDTGSDFVFSLSDGAASPDGFVLNADGSYSFDPAHESYDHLNVGDSAVLTIPVTVTDDQGATDTSQIQITVVGTNDAPIASANVAATIEEGASAIEGQLSSTDLDDGSTATFSIAEGVDVPAGFEFSSDGTYSFNPADAAYDHLNVGDSTTLTIPVTVTDDNGATDSSQIQITVVGTNDGPVAGADVSAKVEEGATAIKGQLTSTDLDDGSTATFSVAEGADLPAGFELSDDGTYSFDPADSAYDHLNVGDSTTLTIPVTVTDDQGAADTSQIQITVVGTNDGPVAGADVSAKVEEGATAIKGQLTSTDLDDGSTSTFSVAEGADLPAGFELSDDGTYSFDPADSAYDHLNVGDSATLTIPVTVTDDNGATDSSQIQITVVGTNDGPVAGADVSAKVEEGATAIKGQLSSTDLDDGSTASFSVADGFDVPAGFEIADDGTYSFNPSDEAYDHLNVGDSATLTIPVTVTDDNGATDSSQIQITVVGTNDAPIAGADVSTKVEEGASAIKGQLTSKDLDDGSTATFSVAEGADLPAGFELSDDGTYSFDPADAAYDHLNVGDSATLTIPVTVTDDQGATDASQIQITVVGTNDGPVAGADVSAKVEEGASEIKGQLTSTDLDDGSSATFAVAEGADVPAGFELSDDGTYSFDPADSAYDHLNVGDSTTLTIPVTVTDDNGATDTSQIQITVVGTNDAPIAGADVSAKVEEGSSAIKGQLTSTDLDDGSSATFAVAEGADLPAGFELSDDGTYSFDPADDAYDHLNVGDSATLTIPVTVTDDNGATDSSQIQITVVGTNDAPIAGADVSTKVEEGASAIKGQLTSKDLDDGSTATFSVAEGADLPAGFELSDDGTYSFDPADAAYDHLNVGDSATLTIPVTVTDDQGATDASQIQITVVGTNDGPVAGADVSAKVEEGASEIKGQLTSTDLDDGSSATFAVAEGADVPAGFELSDDGTYSFDPADSAYDHLNVGDSTTLTIPVTVTDDNGATDTSQIQITVVGTNDAPIAGADVSAKVEEGSSAIKGQLTSTDLDDGSSATFSVAEGADLPAGFELSDDGTYSFDPADEAYDHLNVGDSTTLTIPVTVTDDNGATDTSQIQITVVGTNDAPIAGADVSAKVEEGASAIKGQLTSTDLDDGSTASFSVADGVDVPAGFELADDGTYSFDPADSAYDQLNVGDSTTLTIPVTVTDDNGATDTSQIQITVVGTNDAPIAGADVSAKVEEGSSAIKGQLTSTDLDDGSSATFAVAEGADLPAGFELSDDGTYSFDPADDAYDHLNVGDSATLTIPVTVTDDNGATDSSQIQITVVGTNDGPVADADVSAKVEEGASAIKGQLTSKDLDDGSTATFSVAEGADLPAGFELSDDGTYSFDPADEAYDHLNVGDSTTLTIPVTVTDDNGATDTSQIQITVVGTNDAPIAGADVSAKVGEGASAIKGQLTSKDLDDGSTATFSVAEGADLPAGFELSDDGTYSFDPADEAYDHLNVGDSATLTIPVTVTDDNGATDSSQIQITVVGTNDGPVAGADVSAKVEEGASAIKGQLTSKDLDDGSTATFSVAEGADLPAGFELSDDGTYSFDPADSAYDHLNVGDSTTLTIPVTVTDDNGATDSSQIQITVVGTNDGPVAGADVSAKVEEGATAIKGQLTSTDLDDGSTASFSVADGVDVPAGFEIADDGTYSFDPSDEAYDHLNVGDSATLTIPVTVTDDNGATDSSQIQITVVGTNDGPVAGADVSTKVEEGASAIKGQLTSKDLDDGSTATFSVAEGADLPAGFELSDDGTYSFDPADSAYDHLNVGDSTTLTIPVTVTDDNGATDTSQIQITVVGTNDAPIAGADVSAKVEEGSSAIKGQLTSTDLDDGSSATFAVAEGADLPAGFELSDDGTYSFDPADDAYDHLNVGDSATLTIPVTVTDDNGATDSSQIQITVVGTNDGPVADADVSAKVEEGASAIKGQLTSTDLDDGSTASFSVAEGADLPAGFELSDDGTYSFDPADSAYDHLNVGDSTTLTIPVTVTDDNGATDSSQIQITVVGTNDGPVAGADVSAKVEEGASAIKGQLTSTDLDDGSTATFSVAEGADLPAGFELSDDGTYSFDPADEAYDHLNVGDSVTLKVPVTVTDEHGESDTSQVQITVSGTNDAPVASDQKLSTQEGGDVVSGQLPASDVDDNSQLTFSADGAVPPGFSLNEDGTYEFDPADAAYDGYGDGESHTQAVSYTVTDEHGESANGTLYIGVEGTNDKVSMVVDTDPDSNTIAEDAIAGTPVGLVANATDADGDKVQYSIVDEQGQAVTDGAFAIDANSGVVTVNDPEQIDFESAESLALNIQAESADGSTSETTFKVAVTDVDENRGPEAINDIGRVWVSESTNETVETLEVGTFGDEHADVSDWGELVDGKAVFTDGGVKVTTSVSEGDLTAYNKSGHVGYGIGNEDKQGLDRSETLTIEIEGGDANRVDFTLGGLGSYFDESSHRATEVKITAYDHDGQLIETQGGYRDSGQTEDTYSFETETPVSRFEITSEGSDGTFVVKNMTISATETINVPGHWENVKEDGSITIDVLSNDTDADGDTLSIIGVESPVMLDGVEVGIAEVVEVDGKQQIQFTPGEALSSLEDGENQQLSFEYKISDGQGETDSAKVSVTVEGVSDTAETSATKSQMESDQPVEASASGSAEDKQGSDTVNGDAIYGTDGDDRIEGGDGNDTLHGGSGEDSLAGNGGDDRIFGDAGNDKASGGDGSDTYVMNVGGGSDHFDGGNGGGWTDTIELTANPEDGDSPWSIIVDGEQVEYDLAAGALELQPDTSGVIQLADGSELTFEGIESIQW